MTQHPSTVRTNRLLCTECGRRLKKGEAAIFVLDGRVFREVYCIPCSGQDENDIAYAMYTHPFSAEAIGHE